MLTSNPNMFGERRRPHIVPQPLVLAVEYLLPSCGLDGGDHVARAADGHTLVVGTVERSYRYVRQARRLRHVASAAARQPGCKQLWAPLQKLPRGIAAH